MQDGSVLINSLPMLQTGVKLHLNILKVVLNGQEISKMASAEALNTAGIVGLSQLWTIVPSVLTRLAQGVAGSAPIMQEQGTKFAASSGIASRTMQQALPDVRVFNQVDKNGITSEVVTARTANGLYDYLTAKGLTVSSGSIGILKPYIGGNFSFVVSWVSATNTRILGCQEKPVTMSYGAFHPQIGASCAKGIFVSFPTKDLYYPLIPSGAYSDTAHSETIRVIGHVSPKLYASIFGYAAVTYYEDAEYSASKAAVDTDARKLLNPKAGRVVKYTDITLHAPAKAYTQDLVLKNYPPVHAVYASAIVDHPFLFGLLLLLVASILASVLSGLLFYVEDRSQNGALKFAKLGVFNCLTFIGLVVASKARLLSREAAVENSHARQTLELTGGGVAPIIVKDRRRRNYLFTFTGLFLVINWLIAWLVSATV